MALVRFDDLLTPGAPAYRGALKVATAYHTPSQLNHSVRAHLWAAAHAQGNGIAFDAELLHDIGLVAEFDSHTVPFEDAGGHVAWVFGAGAGWSPERRARASESSSTTWGPKSRRRRTRRAMSGLTLTSASTLTLGRL
ncbi:hypothetical protein [Actinomadura hibisca]|uniref:hypothetical protein n=1 Tax=Actinomadura hibisca TaxID=68565 RepID=UPI00082F265A|nr:hypothetical protein [Actinomadura hibisca]